jgi:hypothetical protein
MKRLHGWAIKMKNGGFVQNQNREFWEADRTIVFRTRKQAESWLAGNEFWNPKASVARVTLTVKEYGE